MPALRPSAIAFLGAQRFAPSLADAVAAVGVSGRMAIITAGWQEREVDDQELVDHLGGRAINLRLHGRADEVFTKDPVLRAAHRERQEALRHRQDFYRIRLEYALEAERTIRQRAAPPAILAEQADECANAIRELDDWHLQLCARIREEFEARWSLASRPSVARHRAEIAALLEGCSAVAIAGGQVATLLNRLLLFGIAELIGSRPIFAWQAGAMALSERVVLFHDSPPQGPGAAEVLDEGLGLLPGVVVLPQPEQRLDLTDRDRVQRMVRRFQPRRCLALPARSWAIWRDGKIDDLHEVVELGLDGSATPLGEEP